MGVECHIYKKNPGVYFAGQIVEGVAAVVLDKPTEYQNIILSLNGFGKSKWSESNGDDTEYYKAKEEYVNIGISLIAQPRKLEAGTHEFPFVFRLPDRIPSSFKSKKCTISYSMTVKFQKPNLFSFDKEFNNEIHVYGYVEPIQNIPIVINKNLFKLFSSKNQSIRIRGEFLSCVEPGERLQLNIVVDNDSDEEPIISAHLYEKVVFLAKRQKYKKGHKKLEGCHTAVTIPRRSQTNATLAVPTRRDLYTIICKVLERKYTLRLELNLDLPHINSSTKVPVVIGFRRPFT